ncbi:hypothetical protein B7486_19865 [cyanobacterium TDX16]|nr:hypothetical protein B7486_19865 [cyanobacterium TDX16]
MPLSWQRRHAVLGVFALSALLRLPALERCPPPLQQDEASRAYDAWCLWETGGDRHGERWPFFLESFGPGDFTAALSTYITLPFVAFFGPGALAVRLPDAIFGVLCVVLLHGWLKRQYDEHFALVAALFLATSPWHISICRTGHESGYAPFFLIAALNVAYRAGLLPCGDSNSWLQVQSRRSALGYSVLAGFMLAMLAWLYPATRLLTPLLILVWLLFSSPRSKDIAATTRKSLIAGMAGLFIGASPLWITAVSHPERLAARAGVTVFMDSEEPLSARFISFIESYAANLSPQYQFRSFDDISGAYYDGVGLHLLVFAPFVIAGLIRVVLNAPSRDWSRFLLAWFALYLVPAAICVDWNPHSFRTVGGIPLFAIIAATGWRWLGELLVRYRSALLVPVRNLAIALIGVNLVHFANTYFRVLPEKLERGYQTALVNAIEFAGSRAKDADFVLVTQRSIQPSIYVLLYAPIPPREYLKLPVIRAGGLQGFDEVVRVGKYYFPPSGRGDPKLTARFTEAWNELPPDAQGLVIEAKGKFGGGKVLAQFEEAPEIPDGGTLEVRWWQRSDDPAPREDASKVRNP